MDPVACSAHLLRDSLTICRPTPKGATGGKTPGAGAKVDSLIVAREACLWCTLVTNGLRDAGSTNENVPRGTTAFYCGFPLEIFVTFAGFVTFGRSITGVIRPPSTATSLGHRA